jgi:2C-methyl-D-erythritol 2,4-cyclodiphosphate synthase
VLEAPKLAPGATEMERCLTDAVGAPVTVKGKRAEGLGRSGDGGHRLLRGRPRERD